MKWFWFNMSREKFNFFKVDPNSFLQRFVTMDETWVYHFQPEAVETSPPPKKAKTVMSAVRVMDSIFWDAGVLLVDYLDMCHTSPRPTVLII